MKFALIALSLLVAGQVSAKTMSCSGTADGKAVSVVIALDDASGAASSLSTSIDGTEVSKFEGDQLQSGIQNVSTDDGQTFPAFVALGQSETSATLSLTIDIDDSSSVGIAQIVAGDVSIDSVELACTKN